MRSGWASRFLFDLVRCETLILVGYSANDAPVRYFLNLLEGDRDRFEDLRTVYALDSHDTDAIETEARWATIAVTPLPYRKGRRRGVAAAPTAARHQHIAACRLRQALHRKRHTLRQAEWPQCK
jgi:hypothetical protein